MLFLEGGGGGWLGVCVCYALGDNNTRNTCMHVVWLCGPTCTQQPLTALLLIIGPMEIKG